MKRKPIPMRLGDVKPGGTFSVTTDLGTDVRMQKLPAPVSKSDVTNQVRYNIKGQVKDPPSYNVVTEKRAGVPHAYLYLPEETPVLFFPDYPPQEKTVVPPTSEPPPLETSLE